MKFEFSKNIKKNIFLRFEKNFDILDEIYVYANFYIQYDEKSYYYNTVFTFIIFPNFTKLLSQYLFIEIKNSNLDYDAKKYLMQSHKEILNTLNEYYNKIIEMNGL